MFRKTKHIMNNNHIRYKIRTNITPRLYKNISKKEKDKKGFSPYIIKK